MFFSSVWYVQHVNWSSFSTMKLKKQSALVCPFDNIGVSACPMVTFSGVYESHKSPPWGVARVIVPPHCDGHQNGHQKGYILHRCFVCCQPGWRPPRQYRTSSRPMAASSGFRCSPGHAASGDAACIASTPPHGHQMSSDRGAFVRCPRLFCEA